MGSRRPAETFRLLFGSNYFEKTLAREGPSIPMLVGGKEVFKLERGNDDQLLISMEVRDERGNLLLKIARNSPVHHAEGVDVDKKVKGAGLRRIVAKDATGNVILDVDV